MDKSCCVSGEREEKSKMMAKRKTPEIKETNKNGSDRDQKGKEFYTEIYGQ